MISLGKIEKTLDFKLSFQFPPLRDIGLSVVVRVRRGKGGQFLSLIEAFISNLSLLRSLEALEKFVVGGLGWDGPV